MGLALHFSKFFVPREETTTGHYIQEGLFCVGLGLVSYPVIPRSPASLWFLSEDERRVVTHALDDDGLLDSAEGEQAGFWSEFRITMRLPHVILIMLAGFSFGMLHTPVLHEIAISRDGRRHSGRSCIVSGPITCSCSQNVQTEPNPRSFLPTLVVALGHEGTQAQLLSAPPWLVGGICKLSPRF